MTSRSNSSTPTACVVDTVLAQRLVVALALEERDEPSRVAPVGVGDDHLAAPREPSALDHASQVVVLRPPADDGFRQAVVVRPHPGAARLPCGLGTGAPDRGRPVAVDRREDTSRPQQSGDLRERGRSAPSNAAPGSTMTTSAHAVGEPGVVGPPVDVRDRGRVVLRDRHLRACRRSARRRRRSRPSSAIHRVESPVPLPRSTTSGRSTPA